MYDELASWVTVYDSLRQLVTFNSDFSSLLAYEFEITRCRLPDSMKGLRGSNEMCAVKVLIHGRSALILAKCFFRVIMLSCHVWGY